MRQATLSRTTKETEVSVALNLDGSGNIDVNTGIGFFDHMLTAFAFHARFDLTVQAKGDLHVDDHHTVEDVGIVLGQCLKMAYGDKAGITRYGSFYVPMDEALAFCSVDISGRPYVVCHLDYHDVKIGEMDTATVSEFFKALGINAAITLHVAAQYGENDHHKVEAMFKAAGNALRIALSNNDSGALLSTKGVL